MNYPFDAANLQNNMSTNNINLGFNSSTLFLKSESLSLSASASIIPTLYPLDLEDSASNKAHVGVSIAEYLSDRPCLATLLLAALINKQSKLIVF